MTTLNPMNFASNCQRAQYSRAKATIARIDAQIKALQSLDQGPTDSNEAAGLVSYKESVGAGFAHPNRRSRLEFDPASGQPLKMTQVGEEGTAMRPERFILDYQAPGATLGQGDKERFRLSYPWRGDSSSETYELDRQTGVITVLDGDGHFGSMFSDVARQNGFIDA